MPSVRAVTLATLKIGSTAVLGVLTGVHLTFSLSTIQAILSLPSAAQARNAFACSLKKHAGVLTCGLTFVPTGLLTVAYILSPSRLRHPYLLMAAAFPGLSIAYDCSVLSPLEEVIARPVGGVDEELLDARAIERDELVNGEVVRIGLEKYRKGNLVKAGMIGMAFLVAVVGNWGDGWVGYGL